MTTSLNSFILIRGGSCITSYKTITSDIDLFCIYNGQLPSIIKKYAVQQNADIECKEFSEFSGLIDKLMGGDLSVSINYSNLNFYDLRFLARCITGEIISPNELLFNTLTSVKLQLRAHLANHFCTKYAALYKDIYGLTLCDNFETILLIAAEFVQNVLMTVLLLDDLVDPSPKWVFELCKQSHYSTTKQGGINLGCVLRNYKPSREWSLDLLNIANSTLSRVLIGDKELHSSTSFFDHFENPEICVLGNRFGYHLFNVITDKIFPCNSYYLASLGTYQPKTIEYATPTI